jgi:hypothetical protein
MQGPRCLTRAAVRGVRCRARRRLAEAFDQGS